MKKKEKAPKTTTEITELAPRIKEERPITKDCFKITNNSTDSMIELSEFMTEGEPGVRIYSIKFSWDNKYIAVASESGIIQIYSTRTKSRCFTITPEGEKFPISYIRWRPENSNFKTRNIFVTTNSDGQIQYWHLRSGKCLATIKDDSKDNLDKQLFGIDYNPEGTKLASCGGEPVIRIYDEYKHCLDTVLGADQFSVSGGHTTRVYCVKYSKNDPNVVFSGGWDQVLIIWDVRVGKPVNSIYGPLICGDGIDVSSKKGEVVTASHKERDQLQRWDVRKGQLVETIDWDQQKISTDPCFLYAAQFDKKEGDIIAAGGSNANQVKLFDVTACKTMSIIHGLPRQIYTLDFSYDNKLLAISGADGYIRVFQLKQ